MPDLLKSEGRSHRRKCERTASMKGRNGDEMDDPGSESTPGHRETFAEDRRRRLHRGRLVGFSVCFVLWVLSVVPLARESMGGREGAGAVAVYLAAGAITLGVAAVIRGIYVLLRKLRFWSPWVFLLAAVLALAGYVVQNAGPGGLISAPQLESVFSVDSPPAPGVLGAGVR